MKENKNNYNSVDELWILFLEGDMQAFHSIYSFHYQMLYNFGLKFLKPAKVEDCIHDTFLSILNYKDKIKTVKNVKAYLFRSFRNQAIKTLKDNKLEFNLIEGKIPQEEEEEEGRKDKEKILIELNELILQLSPREREIIYLKYFQEFNNKEIAELLDIKYQTVRNILSDAIKKMRVLSEDFIQLLFLSVRY